MKAIRLVLIILALALVGVGNAYARDSFSVGINIGGPGYYAAPPVRYYSPPPAVYYAPPPVYYRPAPPVYYGNPYPRSHFRYYDDGPRHNHHHDGWGRRDWR